VFTVAGVTGVIMTLALILMVSSATELIRYDDQCYCVVSIMLGQVASIMSDWVAAFVRSHVNDSQLKIPFERATEQTTETIQCQISDSCKQTKELQAYKSCYISAHKIC